MARFFNKSKGGNTSSIYSHTWGAQTGVKVYGHVTVSGEQEFHVYATSGADGSKQDRMIGVLLADGRFFPESDA
jgi:hypothetical protein